MLGRLPILSMFAVVLLRLSFAGGTRPWQIPRSPDDARTYFVVAALGYLSARRSAMMRC